MECGVIPRVYCNTRTRRDRAHDYPYKIATVGLRSDSPGYCSKWDVNVRGRIPDSHK